MDVESGNKHFCLSSGRGSCPLKPNNLSKSVLGSGTRHCGDGCKARCVVKWNSHNGNPIVYRVQGRVQWRGGEGRRGGRRAELEPWKVDGL